MHYDCMHAPSIYFFICWMHGRPGCMALARSYFAEKMSRCIPKVRSTVQLYLLSCQSYRQSDHYGLQGPVATAHAVRLTCCKVERAGLWIYSNMSLHAWWIMAP
jgi:hypothetical protein